MKSKEMKPKFKKHEIVRIKISNVDFLKGKLAHIVDTIIYDNGNIEYSLLTLDGISSYELELVLEEIGDFLSEDKIKIREEVMSRKNKFKQNEIVKVIRCDNYPEFEGGYGYVDSSTQSVLDGSWGYGVWMYKEDEMVSFKEYELESTGEFLSEEEIKKHHGEGSSMKVTQEGEVTELNIKNPKNWRERTAKPENVAGFMSSDEE